MPEGAEDPALFGNEEPAVEDTLAADSVESPSELWNFELPAETAETSADAAPFSSDGEEEQEQAESLGARAGNIVRFDRYEAQDAYADRDALGPIGDVRPVEDAEVEPAVTEDAYTALLDGPAMEAALAAELASEDDAGDIARDVPETAGAAVARLADEAPSPAGAGTPDDFEDEDEGDREPTALEKAAAAMLAQRGDAAPPFDPAAVTEHDQKIEPTFELDLPGLPGDDDTPIAPSQDDFEMHDSELMDLFRPEGARTDVAAEQTSEAGDDFAALAATGATTGAAIGAAAASGAAIETRAAASGRFDPVMPAATDYSELERMLSEDFGAGTVSSYPERREADVAEVVVGAPAGGRRSPRLQSIAIGAAAIVLVGGVAFVGWTFLQPMGDTGSAGGPRIIAASKNPVKQKPAEPGGKTVPNQNKIVYDKVDGTEGKTAQQPSLVSTAETPVDVVQRTLQPDQPADGGSNGVADAAGKGQARIAPDKAAAAASPASDAPAGLVPHYVKTMTVTADGKLVPSEQPPAQTPAAAPADSGQVTLEAPKAASEPAASAQPHSQPADAGLPGTAPEPAKAAAAPAAPVPVARPKSEAPTVAAAEPAQSAPTTAVAPKPAAPKPAAPKPAAQKPAAPQPAKPASPPAAKQTAAATQAAGAVIPGSYMIQIASQPTEAGAKASYANLAKRYGSVIGGKPVDIQKADIAGKGVYYRVRIGAGSRQDAITLCESYRAAGGSCYVTH